MKVFSHDLRQRVLNAFDAGEATRQQIANRFGISVDTVKKYIKQRNKSGNINEILKTGRTPVFHGPLLEELEAHVRAHPDVTLEEIKTRFNRRGIDFASLQPVLTALNTLNLRRKKTLIASEQTREDVAKARTQWRDMQSSLIINHPVFIDETGAKTDMTRRYGRVKNGDRVLDQTPSGHWEITTIIGAMRLSGETPSMILPGATDRMAFEVYLREVLAPTLRPGDVVIMDNLLIHKSNEITKIINDKKSKLLYLPPYSPDLNPIEKMWSKIKTYLRSVKARSEPKLFKKIGEAFRQITPQNIKGWFKACGYVI